MSESGNGVFTGEEDWDEARLLAHLEAMGIPFRLYRHPPLHTVEESRALRGEAPGAHVKNMFLKGQKGDLWLVTCLEDRRVRIRDLEKALGSRKMSFGKPELLWETLRVRPGAVTPLAVLADAAEGAIEGQPRGRARLALDRAILEAALVNCHPLHNEATVALSPADLLRVVEAAGHPPLEVDFDALEAKAAAGG